MHVPVRDNVYGWHSDWRPRVQSVLFLIVIGWRARNAAPICDISKSALFIIFKTTWHMTSRSRKKVGCDARPVSVDQHRRNQSLSFRE